jgi:hypothetical protein
MTGGRVLGLDWPAATHIAQLHSAPADAALVEALMAIEIGRLIGQQERGKQ